MRNKRDWVQYVTGESVKNRTERTNLCFLSRKASARSESLGNEEKSWSLSLSVSLWELQAARQRFSTTGNLLIYYIKIKQKKKKITNSKFNLSVDNHNIDEAELSWVEILWFLGEKEEESLTWRKRRRRGCWESRLLWCCIHRPCVAVREGRTSETEREEKHVI